jgi:hypothetical protein
VGAVTGASLAAGGRGGAAAGDAAGAAQAVLAIRPAAARSNSDRSGIRSLPGRRGQSSSVLTAAHLSTVRALPGRAVAALAS